MRTKGEGREHKGGHQEKETVADQRVGGRFLEYHFRESPIGIRREEENKSGGVQKPEHTRGTSGRPRIKCAENDRDRGENQRRDVACDGGGITFLQSKGGQC